ncbi:MAG: C_GCAxxG_C_C family protein [Firmicutes bacterium]|nr:C_GCAxxG_C_C family protein [Bacillota bacterium]
MTKEERIQRAVDAAVETHMKFSVCGRSAMYGLKQAFDFIPDEFVTASMSLSGGGGAGYGSCGAYSSALMVTGLKYNPTIDQQAKDPGLFPPAQAKFMELRDRFKKEFGTILCPEIHKQLFGRTFDFTDPKELEMYMNMEGRCEKCAQTVARAVRITCEMLMEDED